MSSPSRMRPGAQAHPGDVTGRKREQLSKEHAEELAAREGELAMVNANKRQAETDEVIDPVTREVFNVADGSITSMDPDDDDEPIRMVSTGGSTAIEEMPEPKPNPAHAGRVPNAEEKVIIRVNADLEDVTLGYGTTVSFKQGSRYRVSSWVADHLEDKGLIWSRG